MATLAIDLRDGARPGEAIIAVRLQGAGVNARTARFAIRRPGYAAGENLGADGWQVSEATLAPVDARPIDGGVEFLVGPTLVQHMQQGNFEFILSDGGLAVPVTGRFTWRNVRPYVAGSSRRRGGLAVGDAPPMLGGSSSGGAIVWPDEAARTTRPIVDPDAKTALTNADEPPTLKIVKPEVEARLEPPELVVRKTEPSAADEAAELEARRTAEAERRAAEAKALKAAQALALQERERRRRPFRAMVWAAFGLAVVLAIAGAAYWWYTHQPIPPTPPTPPVIQPPNPPTQPDPPTPPPSPPPTPPSIPPLDEAQNFLRSNPPPSDDAIFNKALDFEKRGAMDAAVPLFRKAADDGYGPASHALGRVYDPTDLSPPGSKPRAQQLPQPNPLFAAIWYKRAVAEHDASATADLDALTKWAQAASARGDAGAAEALRELGK